MLSRNRIKGGVVSDRFVLHSKLCLRSCLLSCEILKSSIGTCLDFFLDKWLKCGCPRAQNSSMRLLLRLLNSYLWARGGPSLLFDLQIKLISKAILLGSLIWVKPPLWVYRFFPSVCGYDFRSPWISALRSVSLPPGGVCS